MNSTPAPTGERYLFDHSSAWSTTRSTALERCYDPVSRRNLAHTGIGPGRQCLEAGGGAGPLGIWLADAVGADGQVTVTDPALPPDRPPHAAANLRLTDHDIANDTLPDTTFDLIHARLVLLHLPRPHRILKKLLHALKPGGHLVPEDFDRGHVPPLHTPDA
ncbi:class I SAM-dependent methyltransferase, partial [Streptomyces daliensis]|nr:class I SAM-dependent methyltransferase [Streptomyces daliensis]